MRQLRTILAVVAWLAMASGCSNFGRFKPYQPTSKPIAGSKRHRVRINIFNAPYDFTIYKREEHPDKYKTPIGRYLADALRKEFLRAGFRVTDRKSDDAISVNAYVNQFDLGYEKYWWTTAVYCFGYSRVSVMAIADLTVEVTVAGDRYRRRFVASNKDHSRLLWIGLLLPVIPLPVSGFYDEADLIAGVASDCLRRVVRAVDDLVTSHGG